MDGGGSCCHGPERRGGLDREASFAHRDDRPDGPPEIVLDGWDYEERGISVDSDAAGDTWQDRSHLRNDWTATIRGFMAVSPPYTNFGMPVGTEAVVALKVP